MLLHYNSISQRFLKISKQELCRSERALVGVDEDLPSTFFPLFTFGTMNFVFNDLQKDKSKKESFQRNNFKSKFKKILMATWEELYNEEEADKEEANLALMTSTFSYLESEVGSDSDSEDT
ncbi:hypothetical protein KIW84_076231 [Lathyrus oleraceus]|uniref:Uncharacterized protein n=1 Tax=Pisum sativum TaxID=3888 RepID=A0A9D4VXJ3_PEA|nr:hypothetical protein KIW84_076231 [Pisum sativum]